MKFIRKILQTVLILLMVTASFGTNILAEEGSVEDIYLRPGDKTTIVGEGDYNPSGVNSEIAEVELISTLVTDEVAQLGTNNLYNGDLINLSDCLYKFTLVNSTDHEYNIESLKNQGQFLDVRSASISVYHSTYNYNVMLKSVSTDKGEVEFGLFDKASTRCLFFQALESVNKVHLDHYYWNPNNLTKAEKSLLFHIYKKTTDTFGNTFYEMLNEYPSNGDECLIVADLIGSDGNTKEDYRYAIYPNTDHTSSYTQVAKWHVGSKTNTTKEVKVTAVKDGLTSFKIGDVTYKIHVAKVPTKVENSDDITDQNGNKLNKIVLSTNSTYQLKVDNPSNIQYWMHQDPESATVVDGLVTAIGTGGAYFKKSYLGYVDKDNNIHSIEVVVINQATSADRVLVETYLDIEDYRTEVAYAWFTRFMEDSTYNWATSDLKAAMDKEKFFIEFDKNENYGLVFLTKTADDREYDPGDIKVNGVNYNAVDVATATASDFGKITDVFGATNVDNFITLAKEQGYQKILIFSKPDNNGALTKDIYLDSTYVINLKKVDGVDYTNLPSVVYTLDVTPKTGDSSLKALFNITDEQLENSIAYDFKVMEGSNALENVELTKPLEIYMDIEDLLDYDTAKIESREFVVKSYHSGNIIDREEFEIKDNLLCLKADKFSPFIVLVNDTLRPNTKIHNITFTDIASPVTNETPADSVTGLGEGYSADISWTPDVTKFEPGKVYVATITLDATEGYEFADDVKVPKGWTIDSKFTAEKLILSKTFEKTKKPESSGGNSETTVPYISPKTGVK